MCRNRKPRRTLRGRIFTEELINPENVLFKKILVGNLRSGKFDFRDTRPWCKPFVDCYQDPSYYQSRLRKTA